MYYRVKIQNLLGTSFGPLHPTTEIATDAAQTMLRVHSAPVRVEVHEMRNPHDKRDTRVVKTLEKLA
ncbi:hypothetical protein WJ96_05240 [Burkholderia ubonensis]|uniref:Uncharacterized protein n=1 Tax=Burkholderia ubonensis TaxID=101571 RepID=A0AAW3N1V6_9BURK|nr:hypothetical protein WJ93_07040 [Burkholderia ubonensis]KVP96630.1 hypothetical protein WJ97_12155 [Burkholderia ubonensis]KVP97976.1 hypothetical protein WJ96_05240 [Burkholderia ubonensis]KVZ92673.1 hypothetical protein WL25_16895 [Burkholderia ubonensis]